MMHKRHVRRVSTCRSTAINFDMQPSKNEYKIVPVFNSIQVIVTTKQREGSIEENLREYGHVGVTSHVTVK